MSKGGALTIFANLGENRFALPKWWSGFISLAWPIFIKWRICQNYKNIGWSGNCVAPTVKFKQFSEDGTRKWVFEVTGGSLVGNCTHPMTITNSLDVKPCISSQVGCALDCSFCSTGKQGFERDFIPSEIIGQLWVANQSYMENVPVTERENRVTNVVMMGMGEPFVKLWACASQYVIDARWFWFWPVQTPRYLINIGYRAKDVWARQRRHWCGTLPSAYMPQWRIA